jgi:outer membrane protein assembly factor BamA
MQRQLLLFLTTAVILAACSPAAAQKFLPKNIQFKGAPDYSGQELLDASGLKKGTALTVDEMKGHFQRLMDTGVFENVAYKFDGVDLVYSLTPSTLMYPIRLENLPLTPGKELDAKLHDRFLLYHGKVPPEGGLLESVRQALEEMLAAQGIKATVAATPFGAIGAKTVSAMNFSITSLPVQVGSIQVQGVSPEIQARISSIAAHITGTAFDTENTQIKLEHAFQSFYDDEGYAAAKVRAARSGDAVVTPANIGIPYSISVEEGRRYKLGAVHLPPDALVTQSDIEKLTTSHTETPSRGAATRAVWGLISARYKAKGYLDCALTPHPKYDEASGVVNYSIDIVPGPVYHLALVKFENVSDELRSHLMRNWQLLPGDPFDEGYVANFVLAAQKADPILQRSLMGVKFSFDVRADQQTHEVNVVIRFERRT